MTPPMPGRRRGRGCAAASRCARSAPGWRPRVSAPRMLPRRSTRCATRPATPISPRPAPSPAGGGSGRFAAASGDRAKELAAFARAGFARAAAEAVLACADPDEAEALARGEG